jgi:nitronate monooxygenase
MPTPASPLLDRIGLTLPIIQAPMAGISTPAMAAAVTNAGGLGSIAVGAMDMTAAATAIAEVRRLTAGPFNVNVFCHAPAVADPAVEAAWIEALRPSFEALGAQPPTTLGEIYSSFSDDAAMQQLLLDTAPPVVSFHFGLPARQLTGALHARGSILIATATSLAEGQAAQQAGMDAVVAQGWEAGGHRGAFDPHAADSKLGTMALVRLLAKALEIPVIAAGGLMDGSAIRAALALGAVAGQLGTVFIACDESTASPTHRAALRGAPGHATVMTRIISGRMARALPNRFTELEQGLRAFGVPAYPRAYDLAKALNAAALAKGETGFGAQWAGQGAPLVRPMGTSALMTLLAQELEGDS